MKAAGVILLLALMGPMLKIMATAFLIGIVLAIVMGRTK